MKIFNQYTILLFLISFSQVLKANPDNNSKGMHQIHLNIFTNSTATSETLTVALWNNVIDLASNNTSTYTAIKNAHGYYAFDIPVANTQGYFLVSSSPDLMQRVLEHQLWEIGDSINIYLNLSKTDHNSVSDKFPRFSGQGAEKYVVRTALKQIIGSDKNADKKLQIAGDHWNGNLLDWNMFDAQSSSLSAKLQYLDKCKSKISDISYNILKADLYFDPRNTAFIYNLTKAKRYLLDNVVIINAEEKLKMQTVFRGAFGEPMFFGISAQGLAYSIRFVQFYIKKMSVMSLLVKGEHSDAWVMNQITENSMLERNLKETLIMYLLWVPIQQQTDMNKLYTDAKAYIQNKDYLNQIAILNERISGKRMANFKLHDSSEKLRSLSEFKNKIVLIDFWFTGCGGCAYYYTNTLKKVVNTFKNNKEIVFISISIDKNRETWLKSIQEHKYTSPDAINLYTDGLGSQHDFIKGNNIIGYPTMILLSKDGRIKEFSFGNLFTAESLTKRIAELL